ncbi:hypothetical protein [Flavobacterium sp. H122]|uniref:hypothetical protein n=1 Tax=Flavobacterium sp. H122 TaxID=2529860 RepID=UPI0010AB1FE5|nr:hypothetical protein [Flavobacterium sp. H122]
MQIKKSIITLFIFLVQTIVFGQTKLIKDLDNDGIKDTVFIDSLESVIICKLSTLKFKPVSSKPIEILNPTSGVYKTKNGFEFFNDWMRAGYKNQFRYNVKTKKIQLIGMSRYEFGNAANYGSGESSVNLLTGDYIGNWNYYDMEIEKLISIPTIKTKMKFTVTNLEDFGEETYFNYAERCAELYQKHKEIKMNKK